MKFVHARVTPPRSLMELCAHHSGGQGVALAPADRDVFMKIGRWVREYLCQPHEALGREGSVCPYAKPSLTAGLLHVGICWIDGLDDPRPEMLRVMLETLDGCEARAPVDGKRSSLKATLMVFPGAAQEVIDEIHEELGVAFARRGFMLGEFHPESMKTGLRGPSIYPLRSPVPLLGIRRMVLGDFEFLIHSPERLALYAERFGDAGQRLIRAYREAARLLDPLASSMPEARASL
ncbi:MAG: hypothetical protein R3A51_18410 [Nannocystaceae bacterium]